MKFYDEEDMEWERKYGLYFLFIFFAIVIIPSIPYDIEKFKIEKLMGVPRGTAEVGRVMQRTSPKRWKNKWFMRSQISQIERKKDWMDKRFGWGGWDDEKFYSLKYREKKERYIKK